MTKSQIAQVAAITLILIALGVAYLNTRLLKPYSGPWPWFSIVWALCMAAYGLSLFIKARRNRDL